MKNVQHQNALLEQAIDTRAARTLCRDGWSCEQINAVLKNTAISHQDFEAMQAQSKELDKLQTVFGSPVESLQTGHTDPSDSEFDFLNRGPDAAASVLRQKGWESYEINLVIKESMFVPLDNPTASSSDNSSYQGYGPAVIPHASSAYGYGGQPPMYTSPAAVPSRRSNRYRSASSVFGRDVFILTCLAGFALAVLYAVL